MYHLAVNVIEPILTDGPDWLFAYRNETTGVSILYPIEPAADKSGSEQQPHRKPSGRHT